MSYNIYSFFNYNNINLLLKGWLAIKKLRYLFILCIVISPIYIVNKFKIKSSESINVNTNQSIENNENNSTNDNTISEPIFYYSSIPESVKTRMLGLSMPPDEPLSFNNLRYLKLSYYNFNGDVRIGEMIVYKDVAAEVVDIFNELYEKKYPIEKIGLIDDYNAIDEISMANNNTSAFCYRTIANTDIVSNHGKGLAIDINPLQNPHVIGNSTSPKEGEAFADRSNLKMGMIVEGDDCYNAFIKRGWSWGGHWRNPDYQHFEKEI